MGIEVGETPTRPRSRRPGAAGTGAPVYATFLVAQAVLGVVLWVALAVSPTVRSWLELDSQRRAVTDAFAFADLAIIVVGSSVGAWALLNERRWSVPVIAFTAGGVVYPTLYLLAWVSLTGTGTAALTVMLGTSLLCCWVAWQAWRSWR